MGRARGVCIVAAGNILVIVIRRMVLLAQFFSATRLHGECCSYMFHVLVLVLMVLVCSGDTMLN